MIITLPNGSEKELFDSLSDVPLSDPYYNSADKRVREIPPLVQNKAYFLGGTLEDVQAESLKASGRIKKSNLEVIQRMAENIEATSSIPEETKKATLEHLDELFTELKGKEN